MLLDRLKAVAWLLAWFPVMAAAEGWDSSLGSARYAGEDPNGQVDAAALVSSDGRYTLFQSHATNIVDPQLDPNSAPDVFLHDRATDATLLVSRARGGAPGDAANGFSTPHGLSADGRYALFRSVASNLVDGVVDTNSAVDLFLFDRVAGTTTLVSRVASDTATAAGGVGQSAILSPDGRWIAFVSTAASVVPGVADANGVADVFVFDRTTSTGTLVSSASGDATQAANGASDVHALTPDGRYVLVSSAATNLVAGFTEGNAGSDLYLVDRTGPAATLVSRAAGASTTSAAGATSATAVSDDGRYVTFSGSDATSLVAGVTDANGNGNDAFVFDRTLGTTELLTRATSGTATGNDASVAVSTSGDGRFVGLMSSATNLVAGVTDTNATQDAFVHDRQSGITTLVSSAAGSPTTAANGFTHSMRLTADARYVLLGSDASNLLAPVSDTNAARDIFLFDRTLGTRQLASHVSESTTTTPTTGSNASALSADGRVAVFLGPSGIVGGVIGGLFLFDRDTAAVTHASRARGTDTATGSTTPAAVSDDARWVLHGTTARDLAPGITDPNGPAIDTYLLDRSTGTQTLVSHVASSATRTARGTPLALSTDGRFALFSTTASASADAVVAGVVDGNFQPDLYLYDRTTGSSILVSRRPGNPLATNVAGADFKALSANGQFVVFASKGQVVGFDGNGGDDLFLFDRVALTTILITHQGGSAVNTANSASSFGDMSVDGRFVLYTSGATDLVAGVTDVNNTTDVFLYDRTTGASTLVSHASALPARTANNLSAGNAISDDGNWMLLSTNANNLRADVTDSNFGASDAYLCPRATLDCVLVSHAVGNPSQTASTGTTGVDLSADGRFIVLSSRANNLVAGFVDGNASGGELFLADRDSGSIVLVNRTAGGPTTSANGAVSYRGLSDDGRRLLYWSGAPFVVAGLVDANSPGDDLFVFDRTSGIASVVSRAHYSVLRTANGFLAASTITPDGQWVVYGSSSDDAIRVDNNLAGDTFIAGRRAVVTAVAAEGGQFAPPGPVTVVPGTTTAFEVSALPNYARQSVTGCAGTLVGDTYSTGIVNEDCTVTATFVATAHSLKYAGGANGSVTGATSQVVAIGGTGTAVTAVPNAGWHYVQWTDGVAANPRTDSNVVANVDVTAQFANDAPLLGLEAARTVLEDSGAASVVFTVSDSESAAGSLVASANATPSGLLENVGVAAGASPGERVLSFTPIANASGAAVVTVMLVDPAGGSRSAPLSVTVTPVNDAPALTVGTVPTHAAASIGARSVPGFATFVAGPGTEPATQAVLDYELVSLVDPDAIIESGTLDILNDRTLVYTLTGRGGTAVATVRVRDNGGVANAGVDVSEAATFSIDVVRSADLRVSKDNASTTLEDGATTVYAIDVENLGPNAVGGALLADVLPAGLVNGAWTCLPALSTAPCPSPASGTGNLASSLTLGVGQHVRFDMIALVEAAHGTVIENAALVLAPPGITALNVSDDRATDGDMVVAAKLFGDGFE